MLTWLVVVMVLVFGVEFRWWCWWFRVLKWSSEGFCGSNGVGSEGVGSGGGVGVMEFLVVVVLG